jgi:hypothetical protein
MKRNMRGLWLTATSPCIQRQTRGSVSLIVMVRVPRILIY